jgi:hypothetical protein
VPTVALPPAIPLTVQVTAVLVLLLTVAVKLCVPVATSTVAEVGVIATVTGDVMVTPAKPETLEFAFETAVTVTVGELGTSAGAVYRPAVEIVPFVVLPPATPLAVNCCVPPVACTLGPLGATAT